MALCRITGTVQLPDGEVAAGRYIIFCRSPGDVVAQSGVSVVPDSVPVRVEQDGTVDFELYTGNYIGAVKLQRQGRDVSFRFPVPEAATANFQDIIQAVDPMEPLPSWLQEAFDARDAAVAAAEAANKAPSSWSDFQADEFLDMLDGAVVQFNGVQFVRDRLASIDGLPTGAGWNPYGPMRCAHFGGVSASQILAAMTYSSSSGSPLCWDGEQVSLSSDIRIESLPGVVNKVVGAPPTFTIASQGHGVFSIGRQSVDFIWDGDIRGIQSAVRVAASGRWGGLMAFQRNCLFWVEASGFRLTGRADTRNFFTSAVLRGPVKKRDGSYVDWADYSVYTVSMLDERENMTRCFINEIAAVDQDFALTGIQHDGAEVNLVTLTDQTMVQGIDPHAVYMTGSTEQDPGYLAASTGLQIGKIHAVNNAYSMPFKIRHSSEFYIGEIVTFASAGAAMVATGCVNSYIESIVSNQQVSTNSTDPASTAFTLDVIGSTGITVGSVKADAAPGQLLMAVRTRGAATAKVGTVVATQSVMASVAQYFAAADEGSSLEIGSIEMARVADTSGTPTTTLNNLLHTLDGSSLIVRAASFTGAAYYRRLIRQRDTARAIINVDSSALEGVLQLGLIEADAPANVMLSDLSGMIWHGTSRRGGERIGLRRVTDGVAASINAAGAGTDPLLLTDVTSGYGFEIDVTARQATGGSGFAVWKITGAITQGSTASTTALIGGTATSIAANSAASAWAAPSVAVDTVLGGLTVMSGTVPGTIDWTARARFIGST